MTRQKLIRTYKSKRRELLRTMIQRQKLSDSERRRDAHEKIRLGGLIVKAELQDEDKTLLFGILAEAKDRLLEEGDTARKEYLQRGKRAWAEDEALKEAA